jgi:glycosyltransferase involved in cell wall biosynthesis
MKPKSRQKKNPHLPSGTGLRIAVCHKAVHDWDAVGRDIVGMVKVLSEMGFRVTVVGQSIQKSARVEAEVCVDTDGVCPKDFDALIYHHSCNWEAGEALLARYKGPVLFKYHNVTPSSFFAHHGKLHAAECEAGARQTPVLAELRPDAYWAVDSRFNCEGLCVAGVDARKVVVAPPFHLAGFASRAGSGFGCEKGDPFRMFFVGRMVPNKGHATLIRILAKYVQTFDEDVRLDIVGQTHPELAGYLEEVQNLAARLGVSDLVHWHGGLSDEEIADLYRRADVFLCMSEHEGFCVPLIEAQAVGLPVVAGKAGAVAETVGEEQLVANLPQCELDYLFYANLLRELWQNPYLRRKVVEQGYRNYWQRFSPERVADAFVEALVPVLRQVVSL